ncbi:MAG TPA: hypothetical protein IAB47_03625 [Candidatus Scatomorpha merdigallinarum]|nr:hypothetical protein [Candidatus Scatomorpha merdigallinarum]
MKKILSLALVMILALGLAACGESGTEPSAVPSEPAAVDTTTPDPAAESNETTDPAAESTETAEPEETGDSLLEIAKGYEGANVDELIAAIGEPNISDYAPSCLGEGEDGNLYYDGFTVYTYRDTSGAETVNYVE